MALKGKTVIQLYDAKTGELVETIEKTNLVTNAVNNVLNGALNALAYTSNNRKGKHYELDYLFDFPSGYNLAKSMLGGILVFSKPIEEDVEHVIPSISEIKSFIGCGNQGAAISGNTFKGAINSSESEQGDNYVKFVWDFTTEQCNGDIACVCLTSDCGGCLGYGFDAISSESDAHLIGRLRENMWSTAISNEFNSSYVNNPMFWSSFTNNNATSRYIYDGHFYYVYSDKVYKYDISKLTDKSKVGVELTSQFAYGNVSAYDEVITITNFSYDIFTCADDDCVYEFDSNQVDSAYLTLIKVSGNAVTETINIPTTNVLTSLYAYHNKTSRLGQKIKDFSEAGIIYKDKIYFLTGRVNNKNLETYPNKLRMYVLSFDGSFTYKDIECTPTVVSLLFGTSSVGGYVDATMDVGFVKIFDTLFLQSNDSTKGYKYFMVDEDGTISGYPIFATEGSLYYYGSSLHVNNPWLKAPWVSFKFASNGGCEAISLIQGYLGTINNQDTILTKTADKTMKIIYTLTQE